MWGARYRGGISNMMELHAFPFDSDYICISVGPKEANEKQCVLVIDAAKHGSPGATGDKIQEDHLDEWTFDTPRVSSTRSPPTASGNVYSRVEFA